MWFFLWTNDQVISYREWVKFSKLFILSALVLVLAACSKVSTSGKESASEISPKSFDFSNPTKSAHWESNTPGHGQILAGVPINVVINFNFDLAKPSEISIKSAGREYGVGETKIDDTKLAFRRDLDQNAPDGLYTVSYRACWPDASCHDGNFQFAIDKSKSQSFEDLRNKSEVTVRLSQISFKPQTIRISAGTKVTWVNDDSVDHYINTDSHPAHSYFPDQNSKALMKKDSYSLTFDKAGIYPYHCSAHADSMTAMILVD